MQRRGAAGPRRLLLAAAGGVYLSVGNVVSFSARAFAWLVRNVRRIGILLGAEA